MLLCFFLIFSCINLTVSDSDIVFPCITPKNETGVCISLFSCPVLQRLMGTLEPSAIDFIKKSICEKWAQNDLKVCCGKSEILRMTNLSSNIGLEDRKQQTCGNAGTGSNLTKPVQNSHQLMNESHRDYVIRKLLPTTKYCGLQHTDDRFYNETETALDEFPWLVHLLYFEEEEDGDDPLEYADRCNGVLISNRYVLSSKYCARHPKKVRLGQYNTNRTISCVENPYFPECTEPRIEVKIEEQIYSGDDQYTWYAFALFRLVHKVIYTDFVRPICLPFHDPRRLTKHESLIFSGWGANDQNGVAKKRLTYDLTDVEKCYELDEELMELSVNASLICLTPQEGNEVLTCIGDEGSPLMYSYKHQWFVRAFVTQIFREPEDYCSNKMPIVGVTITPEVIEWILQTIRD